MSQLLIDLDQQYIAQQQDSTFYYKINKLIIDITMEQLVISQPISLGFAKYLFYEKIVKDNVCFNAPGFQNIIWLFYNFIVGVYDAIVANKLSSSSSSSQQGIGKLFKIYDEIVVVDDYLIYESQRLIKNNQNVTNIKTINLCFKQMYNLLHNQVNNVLNMKLNYFYWIQAQCLEELPVIDIQIMKYIQDDQKFMYLVNNMHKTNVTNIEQIDLSSILNLLLCYLNQNQNIDYTIVFNFFQLIFKMFNNEGEVDSSNYNLLFDILLQLNIIQYVNPANGQSIQLLNIQDTDLQSIQYFEHKIIWLLYNYPQTDQQYFFLNNQQIIQNEYIITLEMLFFLLMLSNCNDEENVYILQYIDDRLRSQQNLRYNQIKILYEWLSLHQFIDLQSYTYIRQQLMNLYCSKKNEVSYKPYISQILLFGPINKLQYKAYVEKLLSDQKYVYQDILNHLYKQKQILQEQIDGDQQIAAFQQNISNYLKELFDGIIFIDNKCQQQLFQIILIIQIIIDVQLDQEMIQIAKLYADDQLIPIYCSRLLSTQSNVFTQLQELKQYIPRQYMNSEAIDFFDSIAEHVQDLSIYKLLKHKQEFQIFINVAGKESGMYQVIHNKFNYMTKIDPFYDALNLQFPFFGSLQTQNFNNYVETIYCLLLCKVIEKQ